MAYTLGSPRTEDVKRVLCDDCASKELGFNNANSHHGTGWVWMPRWGGIVSIPPDEWAQNGITEREGRGLCDGCDQPC
jgi:hypothetical protein